MNKNRKGIKTNEQENQIIRTQAKHAKFVPLIVMFALSFIISAITIGIQITNNKNKQLAETEGNTEQISAATSVAETSVGTNVKATFNGSTGEVNIYSSSGTGTIDRSKLKNFWIKCGSNNIKTITFDNSVYAPVNSSLLFYGDTNSNGIYGNALTKLCIIRNLNYLNTSQVTNMLGMFQSCTSLVEVNASEWDTGKVTSMYQMFENCSSLEVVHIANWDVSDVTTMWCMFNECVELRSLDVEHWNPVSLESCGRMFYNCKRLQWVRMGSWHGNDSAEMNQFFYGCTAMRRVYANNSSVSRVFLYWMDSMPALEEAYIVPGSGTYTLSFPDGVEMYNVIDESDETVYKGRRRFYVQNECGAPKKTN